MDPTTPPKPIEVIDVTLREGMQYRGLVFSLDQRLELMAFQEALDVDVCQLGYPSAHPLEADMVSRAAAHARSKHYRLRTAALGRAVLADAQILVETGVDDIHFHLYLPPDTEPADLPALLKKFETVLAFVRKEKPSAQVAVAVLDMGKTRPPFLAAVVKALCRDMGIDLISLPDTSGIMAPHQVTETLTAVLPHAGEKAISIHCHNDMGMASANTLAGVRAGARAMEASALGIGERNGLADLFTTARLLDLPEAAMPRLNTADEETFFQYYTALSRMARAQTGEPLLRYDTPVFGRAVTTHVAGTHADMGFGISKKERFYLNALCGRRLVAKFLDQHQIPYPHKELGTITWKAKETSLTKGRSLTPKDMVELVADFS